MSAKNEHQTFPYGDVAAECTEAGQLSSPRDATASEADTTPLSAASVNDDDDYLAAWMREDGKPARWVRLRPVAKAVLEDYRRSTSKMRVLAEASGIKVESLNTATAPLRDFECHLERFAAIEVVENQITLPELLYEGEKRSYTFCPRCNSQERAILIPCLHRACLTCTKKKLESKKTSCRSCRAKVVKVKQLPEEL